MANYIYKRYSVNSQPDNRFEPTGNKDVEFFSDNDRQSPNIWQSKAQNANSIQVNEVSNIASFYDKYRDWYIAKSSFNTGNGSLWYKLSRQTRETVEREGREDYTVYRFYGDEYRLVTGIKYTRGSYIDEVTAPDGAYPNNGKSGNYWYVKDRVANTPPIISGTNTDLGSKLTDFTIPYTITDEQNDKVTVDIFLNGTKVVTAKTVTLLVENTYLVNLGDLGLGNHEVRIVATDSKGESSAPRVYTFTKANTAPVISGTNRHIGGRSVAFTESFRVTDKDGDNITVKISLNGTEFSTITSAQDQDLTFTITDALIRPLTVDSENVIVITATDPNGGVANRRLTFTKTNNPPKIGSTDRSLGNKKEPFSFTYSATDMEGDQLYYRLYLNNRLLKEDLEMVDGKTYSYTLSHMDFIQLPYGNHQIKIEVWDDRTVNNKQYRYYDFTRVSNGLELEIKISEESVMPIKIIAVPNGIIASDAVKSIHVCNNYLDSNPTWELATGTVEQAGGYRFTNAKKTSDKWCVGLRLVIENGASGAVSTINGMKGWFE